MNIILVSGRLGKTRSFTLTPARLAGISAAIFAAMLVMAAAMNYFVLRHAVEGRSPYLQSIFSWLREEEDQKTQSHLRDNLTAMAVRLGQMQAQLMRLDSLGERLAKLAGLRPQEFQFDKVPGQGGAVSSIPSQDISLTDFGRRVEDLTRLLSDRSDKLGALESILLEDRMRKKMLPSVLPIADGSWSSNFGWRIDPFNGRNTFHEGVDFNAEPGTPIVAAAGGVVVFADRHPEYGNMLEVDHGNDMITRYAHASRLSVKAGDVVLRGQKIAEVGNTGRSTGNHLHFEVRSRGVAMNPARFLQPPPG